MEDLAAYRQLCGDMLNALQPAERKRLTRKLALDIRRHNQKRMAAQTAPDGSPWTPRKIRAPSPTSMRSGAGSIRRRAAPMFRKLRTSRHLRAGSDQNSAWLDFIGGAARVARIHHFGLEGEVAPGGPTVRYPARELIGFAPEDERLYLDLFVQHVAAAASA